MISVKKIKTLLSADFTSLNNLTGAPLKLIKKGSK